MGYLEEHDLPLSFGGLYVAFEQLSEAGDLELTGDAKDDPAAEEEQPDVGSTLSPASTRLATAGLARGPVESEEAEESEPEREEPKTARNKKPTAWRNGKEIEVGA